LCTADRLAPAGSDGREAALEEGKRRGLLTLGAFEELAVLVTMFAFEGV